MLAKAVGPVSKRLHSRAHDIVKRAFDHLNGCGYNARSTSFIINGVLISTFEIDIAATPEQKAEELNRLAKGPHRKLMRDVKKRLKESYAKRSLNA